MADILKFVKGMFKDTGQMDQVDGTYRDALNLIVDDKKLLVGNEYGNIKMSKLEVTIPLPGGGVELVAMKPVGQIVLLDDNFIIFAVGNYTGAFGLINVSSIHKVNTATRSTNVLYYTTDKSSLTGGIPTYGDLKFDADYPVTGELRESPIQDVIIYFTDNKSTILTDKDTGIEYVEDYNPPRVFNVTKQEKSLDLTNDPSNLYGNNSRAEFLNLFMDAGKIPVISGTNILKGGGVVTGAYYLGVGYADDNRTETNVLTVSNPVYIVPAADDSFPREMISGAPNGTQTNKSISWVISNLNQEYKFLVPYVIQYSGNAKLVYKLEYIPITTYSATVVYSGLEKVASSSVEEAAIDKIRYLTAKSITQLDNKLYAANLKSRPDLGFQRFANNIRIDPIVQLIEPFDPRRFDIYNLNEGYAQLVYPDPTAGLTAASATLGQYAEESNDATTGNWNPMGQLHSFNVFHTQFQAIDGISESYSYLISSIQNGRSAGYRDPNLLFNKKGYRRGEVYAFYISFVLKDGSESFAYHIPGRDIVSPIEDDWTTFQALSGGYGAYNTFVKTSEITDTDPNARVYQYFDTSYIGSVPSSSNMGYWKNLSERYPGTRDFEIWTVGPSGESIYTGKTLEGNNVRHHRMPSNHNNSYSYVVKDTYFGAVPLEDGSYTTTPDGNRVFNDKVRILGIKLQNITIPKFILKQVQGYKIYYAKRTQGNKTIIGQSGVHPATSYLASNVLNKAGNAGTGPFLNIWNMEGQLKYGGNIVANAKWVVANPANWNTEYYDANVAGSTYVGHPVFKFHDFNLLRKKHTLATATHIDIQYIAMMEMWRGGYKGALRSKIPDATGDDVYNQYYRTFRSGVGDDTYAWIHPDLGNMINFDAGSESSVYWDNPGPKILWGAVYIAARYSTPGTAGIDVGGGWIDPLDGSYKFLGDLNQTKNFVRGQEALLSNTQSILMIEQGGATYINGLSVLKTTAANSFKGATYLYNAFGESGIAISLVSGLPMLGGYSSNQWSYIGLGNLIWSLPMYNKGYGNDNALEHTPGSMRLYSGWDINFNRGSAFNSSISGEAELNQPDIWYYAESLWCSTMMQGHSSLRQPYAMTYKTNVPTSTSYSIVITGTRGINPNRLLTSTAYTNVIATGSIVLSAYLESGNQATITAKGTNNAGIFYFDLSVDFEPIAGSYVSFTVNISSTGGIGITNQGMNNDPKARPNVYVANLCSAKTDVFEPFDKQDLVWTGYYKNLLYVDPETGVDVNSSENYYGQSSDSSVLQTVGGGVPATFEVFGGDTYICRYGYRTTSNLYGLARFKRGVNRYMVFQNLSGYYDDYLFGDIPLDISTGITPSTALTNVFGVAGDYNVLRWGGGNDDPSTTTIEGAGDESGGMRRSSITSNINWSVRGDEVFSTVYQLMVESDDNINYRHAGDPEKGVSELNSMYFDRYVGADVLYRSPLGDLTKMDNILYEDHYSAVQDIRVTVPYPKESITSLAFPNRVIRSATQDGNFNDTYRYFLALQYKDFAVNKGPITNIFNLKALLYIHTERSLFRTKGKQNLELSDATQAYIGSGDLFAQEPDEFIQSTEGYNGLYNKMGALVTKDGYIFVSRKSRRIFLVKDEIVDLTNMGMHAWARENIPFALEAYGWDPDHLGINTDSPTNSFGFLVSYDPLFKRTLITKREIVPTDLFIEKFNSGNIVYDREKEAFYYTYVLDLGGVQYSFTGTIGLDDPNMFKKGGWTISFSNNLSVWASRHSYVPALYAYNSKYLYSFETLFESQGPGVFIPYSYMFEHSDMSNPGRFYETVYSFEIDCIFTAPMNTVGTGFKYTADIFKKENTSLPVEQQFDPGFTSFYAYNTTQISGEVDLVYLNTIRKTDNNWSVNAFRDMSKIAYNTGLANGQINVQGRLYSGTFAPTSTEPMFNQEGIINPNYIDSNKPWYEQRKFVDKFLGIRLIANNLSKNLINLYTVTASLRVSPR